MADHSQVPATSQLAQSMRAGLGGVRVGKSHDCARADSQCQALRCMRAQNPGLVGAWEFGCSTPLFETAGRLPLGEISSYRFIAALQSASGVNVTGGPAGGTSQAGD